LNKLLFPRISIVLGVIVLLVALVLIIK
jgi:hypothetical protein